MILVSQQPEDSLFGLWINSWDGQNNWNRRDEWMPFPWGWNLDKPGVGVPWNRDQWRKTKMQEWKKHRDSQQT